ncbi:alkaline phosphatase family protein [Nocardioides sp. GXQ0305]|uniref:alkaline phosphatase family protein n=1 Tax=Nocardioides sp. GXQ0305 TaxID=3423912 RepID=UPI003D7D5F85
MNRRARSVLAALAAAATTVAGVQAALTAPAEAGGKGDADGPDKVVIIMVDSLSKEIVRKYDMDHVQAMMRQGVDARRSYLGHLGSVTVVTHNVVTTGVLPKHMGWTDEGYRDVDGVLSGLGLGDDESDLWITSNWGSQEMFAVQEHAGHPKLADYLHAADPDSKVFTISPKTYAAWGLGGSGSDSIITFGSSTTCPGLPGSWREPGGINPPSYITETCGRYYVPTGSALRYDTMEPPASLYPLDGDRYTTGKDPDHQGGDVWAADAAIDVMQNEPDWSGIFVTLPGVDKAAHMWGGVDDDGGTDPMTHMDFATEVADEQVGKILEELETSGELDDTLVVLTSDHGSVAGRNFYGEYEPEANYGFYNWYYGDVENDVYLDPQEALQPLVDTGNVGLSYSDSMLRAWLTEQTPAKVAEAATVMAGLPAVTAVFTRDGDHYDRVTPVRWDRMTEPGERAWFRRHAQELVDTEAAEYGPDVIATLPDHTTYSVAGDHGGIQKATQQVPIVFAGAGLSRRDLRAPVRSVDIMPTVLRHLGIPATSPMDGIDYRLPTR